MKLKPGKEYDKKYAQAQAEVRGRGIKRNIEIGGETKKGRQRGTIYELVNVKCYICV